MACSILTQNAIDARSETSGSGTTNSGWTSELEAREDLKEFVTKIGLKDIADLYQDRFRVNRKKLEQMLSGGSEAYLPADVFFEQIMADTSTFITWPSKLKIGGKSKKDPHVRLIGRQEDVQAAKDRILTVLDTRSNRVTMKMDVSYTHHSHIIGKEGMSVKRVMEETHCHVHFPDSNRVNSMEKSNQVSISGDLAGVERARSRVRELIPLIFGFELPIMSQDVDVSSPYLANVQEQFKVQVIFKTQPKLHSSLVLVKGSEWEVNQVKHATLLLMEYMCENLASQIPVHMSLEISPHHHQIVFGKGHSNLKAIMKHTNCQIIFPDAQDPNIPSLKKSKVNISGNIHNVYKARQLLTGSLPLIIIFDLPEEASLLRTKPEQIAEIQSLCDVTINIKHKAKESTRSCVIKGIEKSATNIYKARNLILGIDQSYIVADIPISYHLPSLQPTHVTDPCSPLSIPTVEISQPLSQLFSPLLSPMPFMDFSPQPQPHLMHSLLHGSLGSSGYFSTGRVSSNSLAVEQSHECGSTCSSIPSNSVITSPFDSPRNMSPTYQNSYEVQKEKTAVLDSLLTNMTTPGAYHGPTFDRRQQEKLFLKSSEYEQKRLEGIRKMHNRPNGEYRVPNNSWSGYGISHTSPAAHNMRYDNDVWRPFSPVAQPVSTLNTSNIEDYTPSSFINTITNSQWPNLPTLLSSTGLENYIWRFTSHEIDLSTFASLSDDDLREIGVSAFGARRKMLLIISELRKHSNNFTRAPGSERGGSISSINSST